MALTCVVKAEEKHPIYDLALNDLTGNQQAMEQYKGKVILIVNVASKCGYTKQYKDLQQLHAKYGEKGLVVLGFPCNDFGRQEPGKPEEIMTFCQTNFGVTFPLFEKIKLKGESISPLYKHLTTFENDKGPVKWNFEKFLISKKGKVIGRYRSRVKPNDKVLIQAVEEALDAK